VRLVSARQAAEMLGIRLARLYELTRQKKIPFIRFGKKQLRYDPEMLKEWVEQEAMNNAR